MAKGKKKKGKRRIKISREFMILLEIIIAILVFMVVMALISNSAKREMMAARQERMAQENQMQQTQAPIENVNDFQVDMDENTGSESVNTDLDGDHTIVNENVEASEPEDVIETDQVTDQVAAVNDDDKQEMPDAMNAYPIQLEKIDLTGLSTEVLGWGQGVHFDELNRPVGSTQYQDKYGKYNAYFIADYQQPQQVIYLTFDEGYEYGCTPEILDILKEKNVKAVFFVTLPYVKNNPELVQRMINEGHQLGNHSVTHPSQGLPSQTVEEQTQEVMGCHEYVKENFGYEMHLFRYPTGKFSEQSLAIVNNCNYKSIFWSFAYLDYDVNNQPDEQESLTKLTDRLHPGAIYLLHAESVTNTHILGRLIDAGREKGYSFERLE